MAVVTIRQLLDSGVHFGHQTRRWNPKVKRFILTERSGIHIIDLQQSLGYIDKAYEYVRETVAHGGTVLFVGTKKQAQEIIAEQATRVGQPYVNQRWLGGLLTNFSTVSKRLARMKELEELNFENPAESGFTKKELLLKKRELDKLHKSLGGIRNLTKTPSAIWIVDAKREHLAVSEAQKLGIPVIGILDTNADPDEFQFPIPGNDDAIQTVTKNNLEAAEEIARQLRLRDLGGIVVIDFIDMVLESNRDAVLRRLVECLGRDRTKHQVAEVTSLGLVQMTRKRVGQGLIEAFSTTCDSCNGRGIHIHMDPVKMKAPMPQVNSQTAHHPDVDEPDVDDAAATDHEFRETLNEEAPEEAEAVTTPKGKRRRRAASSGVITA